MGVARAIGDHWPESWLLMALSRTSYLVPLIRLKIVAIVSLAEGVRRIHAPHVGLEAQVSTVGTELVAVQARYSRS